MFLVVVVSMIIDLVCWVWLKLLRVCLYAHAVCVCVAYWSVRALVRVCLCVSCGIRVVCLILFFAFLYQRNLPPGLVTKPFLVSATQ